MRLSGWYVWGMGALWAVVASAVLGVVSGGVLGFAFGMFGIETMDVGPPDPASLVPMALLFAAYGGALGLIYGLVIGGVTGLAATGAFALLMVWQFARTVPSRGQVRWEAAGVGAGVPALIGAVVGLVSASGEVLAWVVPLTVMGAAGGAVIGPPVVRGAVRRAAGGQRNRTLSTG